jgi:hypothetical protein
MKQAVPQLVERGRQGCVHVIAFTRSAFGHEHRVRYVHLHTNLEDVSVAVMMVCLANRHSTRREAGELIRESISTGFDVRTDGRRRVDIAEGDGRVHLGRCQSNRSAMAEAACVGRSETQFHLRSGKAAAAQTQSVRGIADRAPAKPNYCAANATLR